MYNLQPETYARNMMDGNIQELIIKLTSPSMELLTRQTYVAKSYNIIHSLYDIKWLNLIIIPQDIYKESMMINTVFE